MQVWVLGAAAGGGLPQWNCRCPNCQSARAGSPHVLQRSQSSLAVSADGEKWFLLNVSADVRHQLLSADILWPPASSIRGSAIAGCILTDAEIDHSSGLLQLREGGQLAIYCTPLVRRWLTEWLPIQPVLAAFNNPSWHDLLLDAWFALPLPDGSESGLRVRAFHVSNDAPRYVPESHRTPSTGAAIAVEVQDARGGTLLYAPGVEALTEKLVVAGKNANCIMVDGTFWSDDEPAGYSMTTTTARQMGHLPVSGPDGTLEWLKTLSARHRVYVHMNNTNPILDDRTEQHRIVTAAGICIACDGDTFEI